MKIPENVDSRTSIVDKSILLSDLLLDISLPMNQSIILNTYETY